MCLFTCVCTHRGHKRPLTVPICLSPLTPLRLQCLSLNLISQEAFCSLCLCRLWAKVTGKPLTPGLLLGCWDLNSGLFEHATSSVNHRAISSASQYISLVYKFNSFSFLCVRALEYVQTTGRLSAFFSYSLPEILKQGLLLESLDLGRLTE